MTTNYAVPAGEFIAEWLEENDYTQSQLADKLGVSRKHVSELIAAKATLSFDVADKLELVTGVPARVWMNYENLYRADAARLRRNDALSARADDINKFPLAYLRKMGVITAPRNNYGAMGRELLSFFGFADLDSLLALPQRSLAAFRQSQAYEVDALAVVTWIQVGATAATERQLPRFDKDKLRSMLGELRSLTVQPVAEFARKMVELPAEAGVAVVIDSAPQGTRCSGVTHWIDETPVIQLTDRGKKNDALWFTFFHELGHVLLHHHNQVFVEQPDNTGEAEAQADAFARDLLIPPAEWATRPRGRDAAAVKEFAARMNIHPGIVLGRIHRETGDYKWGHGLKQSIRIVESADS